MENQTTIFDMLYSKKKITKPIRLIECFAGYGSQALALKYLGVKFEHWKICEWAVKSIKAYKDIHFTNDDTNYSDNLTKNQLIDYLTKKGISSNYNEPMFKAQIQRLNEKTLRNIYNDIQITHNLVNIQQVKGKDLEIVDTDKYEYIVCYSFPCQDLSLAGKGMGMSDTTTRSGLLWEVERILTECENKPQILLMENVPQVHSEDNLKDFNRWKLKLEEMGYKNYFKDLIATDFGIPQTRNRCFMISLLGDYSYTFPKSIPLKLRLKDMIENNVDKKYYLSDKMKKYIFSENDKYKVNKSSLQLDRDIACSKTTREGNTRADTSDYITCLLKNKGQEISKKTDTANTLMARDYKGFGNQEMNAVIELKPQKIGNLYEGKQAGSIYNQNAMCPTLTTESSGNWNILLGVDNNDKKNTVVNPLKNISGKSWQFEQQVYDENGCARTLKASEGSGNIPKVVVIGNYSPSNHEASRIVYSNYSAPTIKENHGTINATKTSDLRIRKLTPREYFRLMGVKDEDFDKVAKNQSDSSLYHLAGDSIVVNVLMAIFKELI